MLRDSIPFNSVWFKIRGTSRSAQAISSFVHFLERKFGAEFVYDCARIGYGSSTELVPWLELAEILRIQGIIRSYKRSAHLPDEPKTLGWHAEYSRGDGFYTNAGGSSIEDDSLALTKALAEAMERNAWFTYKGFSSRSGTVAEMSKYGYLLPPERFAGYTETQRTKNPRLAFKSSDSFTWVKGYSLITKKAVWLPAQIISGHKNLRAFSPSSGEPAIRESITNGLATHPDRTQALLSGALEVIERDAYLITWLNQISPSRIDLVSLAQKSESLSTLLAQCRRYRLEPHALRLPTDAPAYAIGIMLEDISGELPRFTLGLKAHQDPVAAIEGALLEALRMHQSARKQKIFPTDTWDPATKAIDIHHHNRALYWAEPGRGDRLAFLIKGEIRPLKKEKWEDDTDEEHFARIVGWCREKKYELVSVSFSDAPANVPNWHIEFVVIPELQSIYFNEKLPHVAGKRLKEIPRQFGHDARKPYTDEPHPFV